MNAIIYTRFSPRPLKSGEEESIAAEEDANSIRVQLEACSRYCQFHGFTVIDVLKDPFTSARSVPLFERTEGDKLKHLPEGTAVVAMDLTRVFRDTVDGLSTLAYFESFGITLHLASQGGCSIDTSTAQGKLIATFLLGVAAYEPARTAERTSQSMKYQQSQGKRMTSKSNIPYGWMANPDSDAHNLVCQQEVEMIIAAKQMSKLNVSLAAIGKALVHAHGPLRGSSSLHPQTVKNLINAELPKEVSGGY